MKRNSRIRLGGPHKRGDGSRQRSKRSGRRKMWYDSVLLQRHRLWKPALLVWLLPSVASFSPHSGGKVVPVQCTQCNSNSAESCSKGYSKSATALGLASTVEESLRSDLDKNDTLGISVDISGMDDGVNLAEFPENNGMSEKNGFSERNGIATQNDPSNIDEMHDEIWKRRHARSIQEGIRRETSNQLSSLLKKAKTIAGGESNTPGYAARTISGLIHALAEEADGLEVEVDARPDTPLWDKHVDAVRIQFSRLGFKPLRISGLDWALRKLETSLSTDDSGRTLELATVCCPDEAFDRIDVDKSGALDPEEIAVALNVAAETDDDKEVLEGLASQLVELYDFNGDGVVDRGEYQSMVEDMAALRQEKKEQREREEEREQKRERKRQRRRNNARGWRGKMMNAVRNVGRESEEEGSVNVPDATEFPEDPALEDSFAKGEGSIVLSDLKLDLRRLLFGAVPLVKKVTPGGPLILEPFTMTLSGSWNANDVMDSVLLDAGLRRLVARVLRRRIFFRLRDFLDGAVFYGRNWKVSSASAPLVEVPKLEKVEFDKRDRMIVTGRALVRTSPDSPSIEQAFKVRCKIGTRANGSVIRLVDPELALVIECPKAWERNIVEACQRLDVSVPTRPEPLYSFFPIYSPFKVEDKDGFHLGEDNCIKSLSIKDGALRFEMSAVMRPGRFLDSHYVAFTVPNRTFIITMDRVKEGIRAARKNKKLRKEAEQQAADAYRNAVADSLLSKPDLDMKFKEPQTKNGASLTKNDATRTPPTKSFFSRFVEGYLGSKETKEEEHDFRTERLTAAVSDWFGRQGGDQDEDV